MALAMRNDANQHPTLASLRPTIWRIVHKAQQQGFIGYLARRTYVFVTPGQPDTLIHEVDGQRLIRILTRFTKGLYFHHLRMRVPDDHQVFVAPEIMFDRPEIAFILERIVKQPEINIGGGVFAYRYRIFPREQTTSWLFRFYDAVPFFTWTLPRKPDQPIGEGAPKENGAAS
jgi:hypothetical protein